MTQNSLIVVENLRKTFSLRGGLFSRKANLTAVDNLNFIIKRGEILGLVGESGCGKTTCGRLLVKLLEPSSGKISFEGRNITSLSGEDLKAFRRDCQMIFQDPYDSFNPRYSVRDALYEPVRVHGLDSPEKRVAQAMKNMHMTSEEYLDKNIRSLSGGERQRISIARALILQPEFLVADEPVSMLDVSIKASILNLLLKLRKTLDLTLLFITHDLAAGRYMSDRLIIMYLGKIVEMGEAGPVVDDPLHPYTRALMSAFPSIEKRRKKSVALRGDVPSPINPPSGCTFHPRCSYASEICSREVPPLREVSNDRFIACHRI